MTTLTFRLIFASVIAALIISPFAVRIAPKLKLIDVPGSLPHKQHSRAVPMMGGWVLAVTVLVLFPLFGAGALSELLPVLLISLVVFFFGAVDDLLGLSAPVKLVGQSVAAVLLILSGTRVLLFPPELQWVNILITFIWLVGITNAFNFVDSMDGLAVGLAVLSSGFFMLVAQDAGQSGLSALAALVMGACIGVYFFNASPARLFLGDAGSQWLGFILAAIGILYTPQGFLRSQSWFVPILLVGVPIFDTTLIVVSRMRRGLPWYRANMDHTYHRLVRFGVERSHAVMAMHLAELLLSCLAFVLLSLSPLWANLIFGSVLLTAGGLLLWMDHPPRWT